MTRKQKYKKRLQSLLHFHWKKEYWYVVCALILFVIYIFFRFFQMKERLAFGWDQTYVSWKVKDLLIDHKYPLVGMPARGNSGVFIGPAYYYLLAVFYAAWHLHPIAAGYFASICSIITAFALFFTVKKMFSERTALFTLAITAVSAHVIGGDRLAGPVNLIPLTSIMVFYLWYRILLGQTILLPALATVIGFAFHLHFMAGYYVFISFFCLPLLIKKKISFTTLILTAGCFVIWFIPNIAANILNSNQHRIVAENFLATSYHGIHARRILQLLPDAFIEFESVLLLGRLTWMRYVFVPAFLLFLWKKEEREKALYISYLTILWFAVPWFALSVYKGEISNYYFLITRFPVLFICGYIINSLVSTKKSYLLLLVFFAFSFFVWMNITQFLRMNEKTFIKQEKIAKDAINTGIMIEFHEGITESYLFYYYRNFK